MCECVCVFTTVKCSRFWRFLYVGAGGEARGDVALWAVTKVVTVGMNTTVNDAVVCIAMTWTRTAMTWTVTASVVVISGGPAQVWYQPRPQPQHQRQHQRKKSNNKESSLINAKLTFYRYLDHKYFHAL